MTLSERIASEIMDTIERERRINKDDLVKAVDRVLQEDARGRYLSAADALHTNYPTVWSGRKAFEILCSGPPVARENQQYGLEWSDYHQKWVYLPAEDSK